MTLEDALKVPVVDRSSVTWVYSDMYYDGPISGVVEWQGERLYANMVDENTHRDRLFITYRVPTKLMSLVDEMHDFWCRSYERHEICHSDLGIRHDHVKTHEVAEYNKRYGKVFDRVMEVLPIVSEFVFLFVG